MSVNCEINSAIVPLYNTRLNFKPIRIKLVFFLKQLIEIIQSILNDFEKIQLFDWEENN